MSEDNDLLRPWESDERLKDLKVLTKMELVITTTEEITNLVECLSEGHKMSKTESIPKLWESVKDLNTESFKELQVTLKTMTETVKINKDRSNVTNTDSKRDKESKEISDSDESHPEGSADKNPKKNPNITDIEECTFDEEGHN